MGTYTLIKQLSYNCTAKRCPGQGLYVFKQFRMLGLRHNDSCSPGESARPHGLRPWWCTRKVSSCESNANYLDVEGRRQLRANYATPKKGYTIQLQLRNYLVWHNEGEGRYFQRFTKHSYLKIDSYYEVPTQMLVDVKDHFDNPFMATSKGQGGLRQLRDYVRRRDSICEQEALYRATEKETG